MAAPRDPAFWRRFSVAVHNDDADKEARHQRPELKHSYVQPLSSQSPSSCTIPSPQMSQLPSPTHTAQPLWPLTPQPLSPTSPTMQTSPRTQTRTRTQRILTGEAEAGDETITSPKLCRQPSKLTKTRPSAPTPGPASAPRLPTQQRTTRLPTQRHTNTSQLTLGLSGRPPSRFKFWTSISADPQNRDSWLEAQLKKKRQRTWMCWLFWLVFFALVAGVVIVVLLLRAKKVI